MIQPTGNKTPEGFIFKIMWGSAEFSHSAKIKGGWITNERKCPLKLREEQKINKNKKWHGYETHNLNLRDLSSFLLRFSNSDETGFPFATKSHKRESQFNENDKDLQLSFCFALLLKPKSDLTFSLSFWKSQFNQSERDFQLSFWLCCYRETQIGPFSDLFESHNSMKMKRTFNCHFVFGFTVKRRLRHLLIF